MKPIVFITGATAGIGKAAALKFASRDYRLVLTGRRKLLLEQLRDEIQQKYNAEVHLLAFDIRDREACRQAVENLPEDFLNIDLLLNNAGLAMGLSTFEEGDINDWEVMIDTNVKGLLYITRMLLPGMIARKHGHIINIGSIAGKETYLKGNVYCATKYAVESITKALRADLLPHGIKVSQVSPGAVETEFSVVRFKGNKEAADAMYKGFVPLSAADVAEAVYFVAAQPLHVNINDIVIMPTAQASSVYFHKDPL
jgi:3-hydroxy acid dehydrogenase / malonic semialdehyde reductase